MSNPEEKSAILCRFESVKFVCEDDAADRRLDDGPAMAFASKPILLVIRHTLSFRDTLLVI